jgi:pullulanase/glycogen debranching enzyme
VETWTANPLQTINYIESHDDRCLTDELTFNRHHDGRRITERDAARHRLAATLLFTSLGIPMLSEGQEFMRSKHGIHNTYDRGDAINALRWGDRDRPIAAALQAYYAGLIAMRQSARGASFRCREKPPEGYLMWMRGQNSQTMGFLVNAKRQRPGAPFAVLVNAANRPMAFTVPPRYGPWRLVGNGRELDMSGVDPGGLAPVNTDTGTIRVPPMTSLIYCGK